MKVNTNKIANNVSKQPDITQTFYAHCGQMLGVRV